MCLSVQVIKEQVTRELQISKGGTKYVNSKFPRLIHNTIILKSFPNILGFFKTPSR